MTGIEFAYGSTYNNDFKAICQWNYYESLGYFNCFEQVSYGCIVGADFNGL
ncbi:hypothetical protein GCM10009123_05490 [Kangiella japonica]|uniref:Uncharacterized protein n=1 Tax=Kangiella japonica TaxID=647384 RepID=A0ABP3CF55_9GAMM